MRTTVITTLAVLVLLAICFGSSSVEAAGAPVHRLARATAASATSEVGLTPKEICLGKCAARAAVCVHNCGGLSSTMLGGCKEDCALTAAECAAECEFEAKAPVATTVVPESAFTGLAEKKKEPVATTVVPESAFTNADKKQVAMPANKAVCLAKCSAEGLLCVHNCGDNGMLGGCKENCALTAAECAAECAFEEEAPVAVMVVPESAFTGVVAAAPASTEVANVGGDGICLAKCAAEAAVCVYKCEHPSNGLLGGCKEDCAITAAECSGECLIFAKPAIAALPALTSAATREVVATAHKAVALVEASPAAASVAVPQQVGAPAIGPLTPICLAKCAAEAAVCVYKCEHPSNGLLGGCKEDCALKAAECSGLCAL